jgi:hypothetical protein
MEKLPKKQGLTNEHVISQQTGSVRYVTQR